MLQRTTERPNASEYIGVECELHEQLHKAGFSPKYRFEGLFYYKKSFHLDTYIKSMRKEENTV